MLNKRTAKFSRDDIIERQTLQFVSNLIEQLTLEEEGDRKPPRICV